MPLADRSKANEASRQWRLRNKDRQKFLTERWNEANVYRGSTRMSWVAMKKRCLDPNQENYPNYGGRGITIDARWSCSSCFKNFLADMSERPSGKTLDRIDNDGPYNKDNCKWSTPTEQIYNRRS